MVGGHCTCLLNTHTHTHFTQLYTNQELPVFLSSFGLCAVSFAASANSWTGSQRIQFCLPPDKSRDVDLCSTGAISFSRSASRVTWKPLTFNVISVFFVCVRFLNLKKVFYGNYAFMKRVFQQSPSFRMVSFQWPSTRFSFVFFSSTTTHFKSVHLI